MAHRLAVALVVGAAIVLAALVPGGARAQDSEDYNIEFEYTLLTKRSVLEREFEFHFDVEKGPEGRVFEWSPAVEFVILPRWQIELEIPFLYVSPRGGADVGGIGDIEITNRFLLYKQLQPAVLVTLGLETTFPTGSRSRDLGTGSFNIEPWLAAGIALGDFDVQASVAYSYMVASPQEQQLELAAAVAYRVNRWFAPLFEVGMFRLTHGEVDDALLNKNRVSVLPGFNIHPRPGMTFAAGVEIPVTHVKEFDFAVRTLFVYEF